jgi:hypothetical protein
VAEKLKAQQALKTKRLGDAARKDMEAAGMHDGGAIEAAARLEDQVEELRASSEGIMPRRVVMYNARHDGSDLVPGLLNAFSGDPSFFEKFAGKLDILAPLLGLAGKAADFINGPAAAFLSGGPGAVLAARPQWLLRAASRHLWRLKSLSSAT